MLLNKFKPVTIEFTKSKSVLEFVNLLQNFKLYSMRGKLNLHPIQFKLLKLALINVEAKHN